MDPLAAAFLFCFVFGLAMSGLSFLLGSLHLPGLAHHDAGSHGHVDVHPGHGALEQGHPGGHHASHDDGGDPADRAARAAPSPFNVNTATAFLAFFGGVGYVAYGALGMGAAVALIAAVLAGLAGGALVFYFLVKVLLAGQRLLEPADFRMEGSLARVSLAIRPGGIGEIVYSRDGTRRSEGARSEDGEALAAGTEVVIVRYEKGIAHVQTWDSYARGGQG